MGKYDSIIIGFGKGGKTLAGKLAAKGEKVAMIERSQGMYGGTCINVGCIPSKSLVTSAKASKAHGFMSFEKRAELYKRAVEEKTRLTAMLRKKNYEKLANLPNVDVIDGEASFTGPKQVSVTTEGGRLELEGGKVFINTGSVSVVPKIEGVEGPNVYFSDSMMELSELPRRLVIIGGGYIGLEFASMYAGFGSTVTVISDLPQFLPREDEDVAGAIMSVLMAKGVDFILGAAVKGIEHGNGKAAVVFEHEGQKKRLEAEAVLVATGRRPNTDALALDKAGIETTPRGAVKVDSLLRTTAKDVWALGDVNGGLQFTYVSLDDYRVVLSQLTGGDYSLEKRKNVPYSVFIDPSFSRVGLSEKEAIAAGYDVKVAKLPAAAIPKAQVLRAPDGMLKAIVDAKTGMILGAALLCEESYEMINTVKLAMDLGAHYTVLRDQVFTHPTMSEALNDLFAGI